MRISRTSDPNPKGGGDSCPCWWQREALGAEAEAEALSSETQAGALGLEARGAELGGRGL